MENQTFPHEISAFIESRHCMSISVCTAEGPWSATVFYVFDSENNRLIFASNMETRHGRIMLQNPKISGTISNDEFQIVKIQGIQFEGEVRQAKSHYKRKARLLFLRKFPFALLKKTTLWYIEPTYAKMTDNTLFFSAKIHWERNL